MQKIIDIVSNVFIETDIILVTVFNLENSTAAIADLFTSLGMEGVNINMIALNPSCETTQTISFTAIGRDMEKVLNVIGRLKNSTPGLRISMNAQNCIATLCGDGVETECGVCSFVFNTFASYGIRIKLITTSKRTVACLFNERYYGKAVKMLTEIFKIENI